MKNTKSKLLNRITSVVLATTVALSLLTGGIFFAEAKKTGEEEENVIYCGDYCYILEGKNMDEALIIAYIGKGGDIAIPDTLDGHPVTMIRNNVFFENDTITSVNLPASIKDISNEQFCVCSNLKSITVSPGNKVYTSVNGVLYKDGGKTLAFYPTGSATEFDIPAGVTKIGPYSFFTNKRLTRVTIPSTVTEIGRDAFYNCELVREIYIPDSVTKVGASAFSWCNNLKELRVPEKLSDIGRRAFYPTYCTTHADSDFVILGDSVLVAYLGSPYRVDIPEGVKKVADVFYADEEVESVTIPSTVTSISDRAFYGCIALENVDIPDSVKEICDWAFYGCVKLTSVNIPDGCKIGEYAFGACEKLKSVKINTKKVSYAAFEYCTKLSNVKLGSKVKDIDDYAFYACTGLSSIKLPAGLERIGVSAFRRTGIEKLKLGTKIGEIGKYAFYDNEEIVLTVTRGSIAHTYAQKNGYKMKVVEPKPTDEFAEEEVDFWESVSEFVNDYLLYIIIGGSVLVLGIAALVVLLVLKKKKRKQCQIEIVEIPTEEASQEEVSEEAPSVEEAVPLTEEDTPKE